MSWFIHIGSSILCLSFGVHNLSQGSYGLATWDFGWAAVNFYLAVTKKGG